MDQKWGFGSWKGEFGNKKGEFELKKGNLGPNQVLQPSHPPQVLLTSAGHSTVLQPPTPWAVLSPH